MQIIGNEYVYRGKNRFAIYKGTDSDPRLGFTPGNGWYGGINRTQNVTFYFQIADSPSNIIIWQHFISHQRT